MSKNSAGILLFKRTSASGVEVLLVHPGGPFWAKKDLASWSIPKGEFDAGEDASAAAIREFREETGAMLRGDFLALTPNKQAGGKVVHAWALEGDWDTRELVSNSFDLEWPRGSGIKKTFPEVDKAEWFDIETAKAKIVKGQTGFIDQLVERLQERRT
jgi:predicted NUDIX family NTP pyrophosphohydrolase